jgi:hypothetical protein
MCDPAIFTRAAGLRSKGSAPPTPDEVEEQIKELPDKALEELEKLTPEEIRKILGLPPTAALPPSITGPVTPTPQPGSGSSSAGTGLLDFLLGP